MASREEKLHLVRTLAIKSRDGSWSGEFPMNALRNSALRRELNIQKNRHKFPLTDTGLTIKSDMQNGSTLRKLSEGDVE